jgi:His/Glu/Gln/Arg/opine family amino acid ABC transporter permease subunit
VNFNWRIFRETLPDFLEATGVTVRFGIIAIIIAVFWGILIGSINFRKVKGVSLLTRAYVCFFRETPLLVQIYFLFYGLSRLMKVSPAVIGVIALVLNDGAFIAEIIRGALQSLDKGQEEAASSLGFSKIQTLVYFLIPQAVRQSQDSIMNMVAIIIKDTSLLMWITIIELTAMAHEVNSKYYQPLTAYLTAGAIYMILYLIIQLIKKLMDRKAVKFNDAR